MKGSTHLAAGALTGLFISYQYAYPPVAAAAFTAGAVIGSIIPDIDNAASRIGRRIRPASFLIQLFIGHRTAFHAPLLYGLLYLVITAIKPDSTRVVNGMLAGVASHLLLDILNPAGIPLLWPLSKRFRIPLIYSGGLIDRLLSVLLWLLVPWCTIQAIF